MEDTSDYGSLGYNDVHWWDVKESQLANGLRGALNKGPVSLTVLGGNFGRRFNKVVRTNSGSKDESFGRWARSLPGIATCNDGRLRLCK